MTIPFGGRSHTMERFLMTFGKSEKETERASRAASLAHKLGVSLRTLGVDIALLKKIHAIDRIGPDNGGEWIVQLKW